MRSTHSIPVVRLACVPLVFLLIAALGCGSSGEKTVPVEGTVKLGQEPLKNGTISFHPDAAKGNTAPQPSIGTIENGSYKLATGEKFGAAPGWYKVTVTAAVPSDPKDEYSVPKSLIAEKFTDPKNTPLSAQVKEGGGPYDFEVTK